MRSISIDQVSTADAESGLVLPAASRALTGLGIAILFTLSSMALAHLGFHYETPGGMFFEKFHPSGFAFAGALGLLVLSSHLSPQAFRRDYSLVAVLLYMAMIAFYAIYMARALGRPATFVLDSLVAPCAVFVLVTHLTGDGRRRLALFVHAIMAVNAVVGIIESALAWRLVPFYLDGEVVTYEWRATALLGHPLHNALVTSLYALLVLTRYRFGLPQPLVLPALALQFLALPSFGGRAATVACLGIAALWFAVNAFSYALGRRFGLFGLAKTILAAACLVALVSVLLDSDYVARFFERFMADEGSADTRLRMFGLFEAMSWHDLIFGPDARVLGSLQSRFGITTAIESFILSYIFQSGLFAAFTVFVALAILALQIARRLPWQASLGLVFFFAVNATSTGIASKTVILSQAVAILCLLAPSRAPRDGQDMRANASALFDRRMTGQSPTSTMSSAASAPSSKAPRAAWP